MRVVYLVLGGLSLVAGIVGALLPLVPTVPFLLLAAFCFGRSSPRLHAWLVQHPTIGPPLHAWYERRAIPLRAKLLATIFVAGSAVAMQLQVPSIELKAIALVVLLGVLTFLWTRPST